MRKNIFCVASCVCMLLFLVGCKPSEKNYRKAYEAAVAGRYEGIDSVTRVMMEAENIPRYMYADGDSVRARVVALKQPEGSDDSLTVRHYNVIVGSFRMPTNARSFQNRLKDEGFPASLAMDPEDYYYVFARSFDSFPQAARFVRKYVRDNSGMWIGIPEPYVIVPYGYK